MHVHVIHRLSTNLKCCVTQVESFEDGDLISRYVEDPQNKHNEALADIGLESYLKMLLFDRFFHAVRLRTILNNSLRGLHADGVPPALRAPNNILASHETEWFN